MSKPAAISGTFSDYRLVKSRSVLQLVIEVPVERQAETFEALGYPVPGSDIHVAVARLAQNTSADGANRKELFGDRTSAGDTKERRPFHSLPPAQRAALLCQDRRFQQWVSIHYGVPVDESAAALWLRRHCGIASRSELTTANPVALDDFHAIERRYMTDTGLMAEAR